MRIKNAIEDITRTGWWTCSPTWKQQREAVLAGGTEHYHVPQSRKVEKALEYHSPGRRYSIRKRTRT